MRTTIEIVCGRHDHPATVGVFFLNQRSKSWGLGAKTSESLRMRDGKAKSVRVKHPIESETVVYVDDQPLPTDHQDALKSLIRQGRSIESVRRRYELRCGRCETGPTILRQETVDRILDVVASRGMEFLTLDAIQSILARS